MTDVTNVVSKLNGDKSLLQQVFAAKPGAFAKPIASMEEVHSLLETDFSDAVYPMLLPKNHTASADSVVYTLKTTDVYDVDGYAITQTDAYELVVRSKRASGLETAVDDVIDALRTSSFAVEPMDIAHGYEDDTEMFTAQMMIEFTYALDSSGNATTTLPLAMIYPAGREADRSEYDNLIKQRVDDTYAVVLVTQDSNLPALISEVQGSLLGYGQTAAYFDMEYVAGQNLGGISSMELWREIYTDGHMITES